MSIEGGGVKLRCELCHREYLSADGRVFFTNSPSDAPRRDIDKSLDKTRWTNWRHSNFKFLQQELSQVRTDCVLLDLGTGPSQFRQLTGRFSTVGIDFYPYDLVEIVADLTKPLPLQDGVADILLLSNVLEHMPTPQNLLTECYRILKPGGLIIGTVPFFIKIHQEPYDFFRYTPYALKRLLTLAGFLRVNVVGLGTPLDVYQSIQTSFFSRLIYQQFSSHRLLGLLAKTIARVARYGTLAVFLLCRPIFLLAQPTDTFSLGYGFKGTKGRAS